MRFALTIVALIVVSCAVPARSLAAASSKGCDGFSGTWTTQWTDGGPVKLTVAGTSGTYDWQNGKVAGSINGNVYAGNYTQDNQTGTFQFTLAADGNSFTGWYMIDQTTDKVVWEGTCTGAASAPAAAPSAAPSGAPTAAPSPAPSASP